MQQWAISKEASFFKWEEEPSTTIRKEYTQASGNGEHLNEVKI